MPKVSDFYPEINRDEIKEWAKDSNFHKSSYEFLEQVWNRDMQTLSQKQIDWLERIADNFVAKEE